MFSPLWCLDRFSRDSDFASQIFWSQSTNIQQGTKRHNQPIYLKLIDNISTTYCTQFLDIRNSLILSFTNFWPVVSKNHRPSFLGFPRVAQDVTWSMERSLCTSTGRSKLESSCLRINPKNAWRFTICINLWLNTPTKKQQIWRIWKEDIDIFDTKKHINKYHFSCFVFMENFFSLDSLWRRGSAGRYWHLTSWSWRTTGGRKSNETKRGGDPKGPHAFYLSPPKKKTYTPEV